MPLLLNDGKMAHHFGKWRDLVAGIYGLAICFFAALLFNLQNLVLTLVPAGTHNEIPVAWTWLSVAILGIGLFTIFSGVWQFYKDEMHGAHVNDAERYRREGW